MNKRRTKIVATLGPATSDAAKIKALIQAGANILRINLSHGQLAQQIELIECARACANELNAIVGILVDLQGPKIRVQGIQDNKIHLKEGDTLVLDPEQKFPGSAQSLGVNHHNLPNEVEIGSELLIDDGLISLTVTAVEGSKVHCRANCHGTIRPFKGLNKFGGGLSLPSLTEKDTADIEAISTLPIDYVALSFPKDGRDIKQAKALLKAHDCHANLVAKIERAEAINNIDDIIESADAVMVARGDLGVEVGYAQLPGLQKYIINRASLSDKVVITATQMMESMVLSPIPTRAEVSDVANAILDGTDAVMLSAETATGEYPIKVVKMLDEICVAAEQQSSAKISGHRIETKFGRHDEAIAMASMYIANHLDIKAIVALTESGSTPLWMSRIRSAIPIYGLSRNEVTCRKMTLYRGVYPVNFNLTQYQKWEVSQYALDKLINMNILQVGDKVLVTKGHIIGTQGHTNTLKILEATRITDSEE